MKTPPLLALLALASCGEAERAQGNGSDPVEIQSVRDVRIDCRIGAVAQFERYCSYERGETADGTILILRKPDGGFRRLLIATDGRGVIAADGAEPALVTILRDDRIEVEIGGDRFRLPATVRGR